VVGGGVHVSGHTVEEGVLKTAPVRLERGVTVGVGSVINIGVVAGAGSEIGALSYVPKFSMLEPGCAYAGVPVRKIREKDGLVDAPSITPPRRDHRGVRIP
jgi:acetyltransferase-like isoleucine patch superfamily enzyme